ncbi:hypothetical protein CWE08_02880 [Aliidiomarina iranensis]|uniref:Fe-S metabolism associated domain-containing protein n=1 Tax=Aliidiomarina iranensis TaxID=1434071 RepID=A0A432W397_9GAMM|nr:SufE family protein [Aliidiomarina iranensis]RUO23606.1 hypothetical protein CWE08_02880 [Aliidiomarina iranensis]
MHSNTHNTIKDGSTPNLGAPSATEILNSLQHMPGWEQRYRYVLELAKTVTPDAVEHNQSHAVRGCEAPVWLRIETTAENTLRYYTDSSSRLIRGLLVILFAPVQNQSPEHMVAFSFEDWLRSCGLQQQLTPSRSNGLFHICQHAKTSAEALL